MSPNMIRADRAGLGPLVQTLAAAAALVCGVPAAARAEAAAPACDRACLEGFEAAYLDAYAAHAPGRLPVRADLKFVENDQPLKLGQGSWATVQGLGHYRHYFADPETGEVVVVTTIRENGVGAILDVRLKIVDHRIAEVEHLFIRDPRGAAKYEALGRPEALWLDPVPPEKRVSRAVLEATANKYFSGMERNKPNGDYSFFDPDCNRLEHAEQTTNLKVRQAYGHSSDTDFSSMGCEAQFKTGFLGFVTKIRDRRFVVIDEERQEAFAFPILDHNGTVRVLHMSTGKDFVIPAYFDVPRTLQVGEGFRMRGDKIHRIEMTLVELPYGARPGWPD